MIDPFFVGGCRESFVEIVANQLSYAIQAYCEDLDADDFDPDVADAIDMSRYFNGDYEDIDISKAESYIIDDIISTVEDEIDTCSVFRNVIFCLMTFSIIKITPII